MASRTPSFRIYGIFRTERQAEFSGPKEIEAYMEHQASRIAAAKEGHNAIYATDPKEHQVLPLRREERAEESIFIELER